MQGALPSNTSTITLYSYLSVSFYMGIVKISSTISLLTTNKSKTMQTLTCAQMRLAEEDAVSRGISLLTLMENAGKGTAEILCQHHNPQYGLMLCGKGNNGGDALVMARILAEKQIHSDVVFVLGEDLSELAQINREALIPYIEKGLIREIASQNIEWEKYDFIVDGILGTGFSGSLKEDVVNIISLANQTSAFRLALDIPSGMNADTGVFDDYVFYADITTAFGAFKPAHHRQEFMMLCGGVVCVPIGIMGEGRA